MFWKKTRSGEKQTRLQKRISNLPSTELITWTENALFVIGRGLTQWQRTPNKELLLDAELGAEALKEIVAELKRRSS